MGSDRNERRRQVAKGAPAPSAKGNPFGRSGRDPGTVRFADVATLGGVIDAIVGAGCAVTFGRTRDGGAVSVTVLDDDDRWRQYCASAEDLSDALTALEIYYLPVQAVGTAV